MSVNLIACLAACLGLTFALAGCGGGGGGGNNSNSSGGSTSTCTTPSGFSDNAGADQNVKTGSVVQLDGTASRGAGGADPGSYQWSFTSRPNGSTAKLSSTTSAAPQFTADQAGQYVVKLVIDGKNQCDAQTDSVTVTATSAGTNAVPTANAGADQSVVLGANVTLSGANSRDPDGNTLTYAWQLVSRPDGSSAQLADAQTVSPSFTADTAGSYVMDLRVNDGTATSAPDEVTVVAAAGNNARPVADAGPDQSVSVGSTVRLNGTGSHDPQDRLITYAWHFLSKPDGSNASITGADTAKPVFQADMPGTYVAALKVNNGQADSQPDTVIVTASSGNVRPTADAGVDQNVKTGLVVNLDGSASSDPNGDSLNYRWTFAAMPSGSQTALTGTSTATPSFTPDVPGEYVVQLVVNDGQIDSPADTVVVTATSANTNSAPVADAGVDRNVSVQSPVQLDGSGSSDADANALTYQWTLISRPSGSSATLSGANTLTPSFTADVVGFYTIELTVNDGQVDSTPDRVVITASPTLALFVERSGNYQSVNGGGSSDSAQVSVGAQNVLLNRFRVKALGSDFTIANVQVTTAGNQTIEPYFDGLSSGDQIPDGQQLDFATRLRSVPNERGTYQVQLQFSVKPGGKQYRFVYTVTIN